MKKIKYAKWDTSKKEQKFKVQLEFMKTVVTCLHVPRSLVSVCFVYVPSQQLWSWRDGQFT